VRSPHKKRGQLSQYSCSVWGSNPDKDKFFFSKTAQTGSGAHPASYSVATGVYSRVVNWKRREADHSPLSNVEVKDSRRSTASPLYALVWTGRPSPCYNGTYRHAEMTLCALYVAYFSDFLIVILRLILLVPFCIFPCCLPVSERKQPKSVTLSHLYQSAASCQCSRKSRIQAAAVWNFVKFLKCFIKCRPVVTWMCSFTHWQ
jgi:hypothetical protein